MSSAIVVLGVGAQSQVENLSACLIVIADAGPDLAAGDLEQILSEFSRRGIPVTFALSSGELGASPVSEQALLLRAFAEREVGLFEIAAPLDVIADESRYFQMRDAGALRADLTRTFGAEFAGQVTTICHRPDEATLDLPAFRSAGFQISIQPGGDPDFSAEFVGRSQLMLRGGGVLPLDGDPRSVVAQVEAAMESGRDTLLTLSLAGITSENLASVQTLVGAVAEQILAEAMARSFYLTRPTDYLLQFGPPLQPEFALLLDYPDDPAGQEAISAFAMTLSEFAVPATLIADPGVEGLPEGIDILPVWRPLADPMGLSQDILPGILYLPEPVDAAALPPVATIVDGTSGDRAPTALGADGRLHLVPSDWSDLAARPWPATGSFALRIRWADIATNMQQTALLRRITTAAQQGQVRFKTLPEFVDQILAPEPLHTRLWSTLARRQSDPPVLRTLLGPERDQLLDDAAVAWSFIERFTSPFTGLCAGTVQGGPNQRVNREATYWDLASQMQGIIAASELGIIPEDDARDRLDLMVRNLPQGRVQNYSLPPAMFNTSRDLAVVTPGFDSCDVGRFLIALRMAEESGLLPPDAADAVLGGWDLDRTVIDGRTFDHDGRAWRDVTKSHCTPYIAPVFAQIGLPLQPLYPPVPSRLGYKPAADDLMRLLYAAASLGSFGTEPLLLEAIELGASPESAFLADVLFDAQLGWYEETGELKAVSENPLNVPPWFTYQGLRIDRLGAEAWTILSLDQSAAFQTESFRRSIEVVSSKSAYLWAAAYPHPYSDLLIDLIREKAKIDGFGFSVGVFAESMLPMENYSDLNTNGIILSAIRTILRNG